MDSVVIFGVGGKAARTLTKECAFHPVAGRRLHVDFMRFGEHTSVTVAVPFLFQNEEASPGIKRGGVLNVVRHEVELVCDAASIPDNVIVDLTGTDVGDAIHISHVKLPAAFGRTSCSERVCQVV